MEHARDDAVVEVDLIQSIDLRLAEDWATFET